MSDPPKPAGFTPPPLLSEVSKPALLSQASAQTLGSDQRPLSTGSVVPPPIPSAAMKKKETIAARSADSTEKAEAPSFNIPSQHTEEAIKYAGTVAISALSEIESALAETMNPMVAAETYTFNKKNPNDVEPWISISSSLLSGPIFTLESLAASGHSDVVASTILPWLPAFLAHKGLAGVKSVGQGQPTFDTFVHKINGYSTTNECLCETLECVIEAIGLELLLIATSYKGGENLSEETAERTIQAAYAGIMRIAHESNAPLFSAFQASRIPLLTSLLGQMCPHYAPAALGMFVSRMDGRGTGGKPSDDQKLFLCQTLSCISMDFKHGQTFKEFSSWVSFVTQLLSNAVAAIKKSNDIHTKFCLAYIQLIDSVMRGGNFEESKITDSEKDEEKEVMVKIEALFGDLNLKISPVKYPHPTLAQPANLLMSTLLVRSSLNCYGANLELFLTKRVLPLAYDLKTRDNALHCILRVLRGPRFAEAPPKVDILTPRLPYAGPLDIAPKFKEGVREVAHKYSCIMPEFKEYKDALFRPDSLVWIQMQLFDKKVMKKVKGMCTVANQCAEIMLTISSNSLSPSFIRGVLDYKAHKFLDFFAVGVRTVRIVLDPISGFAKYAATTRTNALLDAMAGIQHELSSLLSRSIPEVLPLLLKDVGCAYVGFAESPSTQFSILDSGEHVDVFRASNLKEDVNNKLQILQEINNALPFIDYSLTTKLIKANLMHHKYGHISKGFVKSLQRLLKANPDKRTKLMTDLVLSLADTPLDDKVKVTSMLTIINDMLRLWTSFIKDGSDGRHKNVAAEDGGVVELDGAPYPAWTARTEAACVICLCNEEVNIRTLALNILEEVGKLRQAQFKLIFSVKFAEEGANGKRISESDFLTSKTSYCVEEFLEKEGSDIVQRALYRYMVDSASGIEDPFATAFATRAPPLKKVSQMSLTIWRFALPVIAQRVVQQAHPSVMEETRRQLYMRLTDGGVREKTLGKHIKNSDLWASQIELTLSLANNITNETGEHLDITGATGGGKWALGYYANPLEKLEQYLNTIWDLLIESSDPVDKWVSKFESAVRAASGEAVGPITRSLWKWYTSQKEKNKMRLIQVVVKLLRILCECDGFVEALVKNQELATHFMTITTYGDVLDLNWESSVNCTPGGTVLNVCILVDKVATAILKSNYLNQSARKSQFEFFCKYSPDQLQLLYKWLRSCHTWPSEDLEYDNYDGGGWSISSIPVVRARVSLTRKEEKACFRYASRAVGKMVQMGSVMTQNGLERLVRELLLEEAPFHLSWFLAAGKSGGGEDCFSWLLAYHTEALGLPFIKRCYNTGRHEMKWLFNGLADQIIPSFRLPKPPGTSVTEDSTIYYKRITEWANRRDLGSMREREIDTIEGSAVSEGRVFGAVNFVSGDCEKLSEMDLLFMCMRALRDPDYIIRNRAFGMVRVCVLSLMEREINFLAGVEGSKIDFMTAMKQDFAKLMETHHMAFSAESSAALDEEGLEICTIIADCLDSVGKIEDFFDAVFSSEEPRSEWGGYHWTAQLLGPFCSKINLTEEGKEQLSEMGENFVNNLFDLSCRIPVEYNNKCVFMWKPLMKIGTEGSNKTANPNVHAIVSFLLYVTAKSGENMGVCQQIALVCYKAFPRQCASWFTFPLTFEMQYGEASKVYDDEDRALQATSVVILLAGLCKVDLVPLLPFLPSIICFSLLKYPTATRFIETGDESAASRGVAGVQYKNIPTLLLNLLSSLQPLALKGSRKEPSAEIVEKTNRTIALLKAGKEHRHMVLDWSSSVAMLSNPGVGIKAGANDVADICDAKSFGAVDPKSFILEVLDCLSDGLTDLRAKTGQEVLNWALHCDDSYSSTLKAHVMYSVIGTPAGIGTLNSLTKECAFLFGKLEEEMGGDVGGVKSTAMFNIMNRCFAALNSLFTLTVVMGEKVEASTVSPSLLWISLALLKSGTSGYDMRFFEYGLGLMTRLLQGKGGVDKVFENMEASWAEYGGDDFNGVVPLLVPGLLSKDKRVASETRELLISLTKAKASKGICEEGLRFVWLMIVLTPFLGENGGSPPTVESVAVCRSLLTGCTEGGLVGGKNLAPILEGYLEGMEVETLYLKVGAWLVVDCGLKDHTSILVDAYKIAVKYGTPETVASLLHLAATSLRKGASQEELASGLSNMVMSSTQNTFNKLPTTNPKVYKASLEIVQAAGGNFAVCGIGSFGGLSRLDRMNSTFVVGGQDLSLAFEAISKNQQSKSGGWVAPPAPPPKKEGAPVKEGKVAKPPPPPSKAKEAARRPPPPPMMKAAMSPKGGDEKKAPPPVPKKAAVPQPPSKKAPPPPPMKKESSGVEKVTEGVAKVEVKDEAKEEEEKEKEKEEDEMVMAKDHPDYAKIFKLLGLGVPFPQLLKKLEAAGLDKDVLDNPEIMINRKTGKKAAPKPPKKKPPPPPKKKSPPPPKKD